MAAEPVTILEPKVLVTEGKDDQYFFEALVADMDLQRIQVMGIGGKTMLKENLKALVKASGFDKVISLGIARDADDDYAAAFASVCHALKNVNLPVPPRPLVPVGENPRVIVMILPKVNENGMLEDVCLEAVNADCAMLCVERYFECLRNRCPTLPEQLSKAKVHTFLSSRTRSDLRLGEAAKAWYWPFEADAFEEVKTFLRQI